MESADMESAETRWNLQKLGGILQKLGGKEVESAETSKQLQILVNNCRN